jgi:hypothetical protein
MTIVFVPLGKIIVIVVPIAVEWAARTVEFAIMLGTATVRTVEFAIIRFPLSFICLKPSPVPRKDGAKMCTSVDLKVPSGCGATVVPINDPAVTLASAERLTKKNRILELYETLFRPEEVSITKVAASAETIVPERATCRGFSADRATCGAIITKAAARASIRTRTPFFSGER